MSKFSVSMPWANLVSVRHEQIWCQYTMSKFSVSMPWANLVSVCQEQILNIEIYYIITLILYSLQDNPTIVP
jgi:hypothetical protein